MSNRVKTRQSEAGRVQILSQADLIPIEEAAALCGLDVKRLRGRIFRNSVRFNDPIGNATHVYRWSLPQAHH